jgi:hypothetical protein
MNQIFFNERHVTGFDAFTGDEIDFLVKEVFEFVGQPDEPDTDWAIKVNQDVNVAGTAIVAPGVGSKKPEFANGIACLEVGFLGP